jgi:hypothetical protein
MSIVLRFDPTFGLMVSRARGILAPKPLLAFLDEAASIIRTHPVVGHLTGVSGSMPDLLPSAELSAVGDRLRVLATEPAFRALPVAVLVAQPVQYGLTRMVHGLAGGELPVTICRTRRDCADILAQPVAVYHDAMASLVELVAVWRCGVRAPSALFAAGAHHAVREPRGSAGLGGARRYGNRAAADGTNLEV